VAIALLDPRGGQASTLLLIQGAIILINAGSAIWVLQAHQRMAGPAIAKRAKTWAQKGDAFWRPLRWSVSRRCGC
jgi:hypothetical protein